MKDIATIRKAIIKYNQDRPELFFALNRVERLLEEAPKFFSHHDFDGEKLDWLKRAGLLDYNDRDPDAGNLGSIIRS